MTEIKEYMAQLGGILFVLMTLIQIAPIKINPWTAIGRAIGRAINHDVIEKVDNLDVEVKSIKAEMAENVAIDCRVRILRFGDEVLHGHKHTKDHFEEILKDIKKYELYCKEHPDFENNVTELTSMKIEECYKKCLDENSFL